jgi:hypothetical protein
VNVTGQLLDHNEAIFLLPFYATGALRGAEGDAVAQHVQGCVTCRRELSNEKRTRQAFRALDPLDAMANSFYERMVSQLDGIPVSENGWTPHPSTSKKRPVLDSRARQSDRRRWMSAALAASLVAIMFGGLYFVAGPAPQLTYRTLAINETSSFRLLSDAQVVFKPNVDPRIIRETLNTLDLEVLSGPNAIHAYSVRLKPEAEKKSSLDEVLVALRERPWVAAAYRSTRHGGGR